MHTLSCKIYCCLSVIVSLDSPMWTKFLYVCSIFRDISDNLLTAVPESLYTWCPNLSTINMRENQIRELPKQLFHASTRLEILDLSRNELHILDSTLFESLINLKVLKLDDNQIKQLPSG